MDAVSSSFRPPPLDGPIAGFIPFGIAGESRTDSASVSVQAVSAGFAATLGLNLRAGRDLNAVDATAGESRALVNQVFVDRYLPDGAVDRSLDFGSDGATRIRIVGVVADARHARMPLDVPPTLYLNMTGGAATASRYFLLRTRLENPAALGPSIRALVHEMEIPTSQSRSCRRRSTSCTAPSGRSGCSATSSHSSRSSRCCSPPSVCMACFPMSSHSVPPNSACGSPWAHRRANKLWLVLRQALALALAGVLIGLTAALGLMRLLAGAVHGVPLSDPVTLMIVAMALLLVALFAALAPAWRAARLHPLAALRG